ncbi:CBS domain-containing protein [Fervidicoccus fontis]|uniref:Inosine-5'-monophosphate dehydrogenase related protein V n=1 Tax=Fervidicoccus fontis (strain DSM 19380 / JCM 18336 / VKM B-2539 / Kam940) TaxID=1163730 RepID=H9ZZX6_FERFK|nr:CBS domain-containing protein [Fervidicoccus fontis]AFH42283.1 inosine-5'-monophosphate dehydrogenase related protein V [Fervidicoccus fontis Kam940]
MDIKRKEYSVKDLMSFNVVTVDPNTSLDEAVRIMLENNIGSVVVVNEKGVLIGILTEKDLITKVIKGKLDLKDLKVKDIMSAPVVYVEPDTPLYEAVALMQSKKIGHLPVVKNGRVVGIIATGDIISIAPEYLELLRIKKKR